MRSMIQTAARQTPTSFQAPSFNKKQSAYPWHGQMLNFDFVKRVLGQKMTKPVTFFAKKSVWGKKISIWGTNFSLFSLLPNKALEKAQARLKTPSPKLFTLPVENYEQYFLAETSL